MKIKTIILTITLLLLSACTTSSFYRYQGFNTSECGPAVACMVAELSGKSCKNPKEARATNKSVKYWDFAEIKEYLNSRDIEFHSGTDDITIYKVKYFFKPHFIVVVNNEVYDPIFGSYPVEQIDFDNTVYFERLGVKR